MDKKPNFSLLICLFWLLLVGNSWAAGLGGIDLDSYLNQPLKARIELLNVPVDQVGTVSARLASADDYRLMGLDPRRLTTPLVFKPSVWRGKAVIEVTSTIPVRDPILQFAVDVTWQRGNLLKEYTLFLDPPTLAVAPPRKAGQTRAEEKTPVRRPSVTTTTRSRSAQVVNRPSSPTSDNQYGPVKTGDTLWSIAKRVSAEQDYSVNRTMLAIVRLNPEAFTAGDVNRMHKGAILRLPSAEDIAAIPAREADDIVSQQISAWREQTTVSTPAPILAAQAAVQTASPEPAPQARAEKTTGSVAATEDGALARIRDDRLDPAKPSLVEEAEPLPGRLEIVPPAEEELADLELENDGSAGGDESGNNTQLEQRLSAAEAELLAAVARNDELAAQVQKLEVELKAVREGLNLNDPALAALQQEMTETPAEPVADRSRVTDQTESSWLERWWWLGLLVLMLVVFLAVWWMRRNAATETEAESTFVDAVMSRRSVRTEEPRGVDEATLAADAEHILEILKQDESRATPDADEVNPVVGSDIEEETEAREFLDKLDGIPGSSEDAMVHLDDIESHIEDLHANAEEEILSALESDDDSAADKTTGNEGGIEVKLDLARAYLVMKDCQAARSILEEVLQVGSEQQQREARSMLDEIQ